MRDRDTPLPLIRKWENMEPGIYQTLDMLLLKIWTNIHTETWGPRGFPLLLHRVCFRGLSARYSQVLVHSTAVNSRLAIGTRLHALAYATL